MSLQHNVNDPALIRGAFGHYPSGVAALAADIDGERHVIVASSFMVGISMDPPLVSFAPQHTSATWPLLRRAERIGVSVLGQGQGELCRQLSNRDRSSRFNNVETAGADNGAVFVHGAAAWMDCSLYAETEAGDHDMVLLRVHSLDYDRNTDPLVFHGSAFRELLVPIAA